MTTAHDHTTHVKGCYRCDLSQDEAYAQMAVERDDEDRAFSQAMRRRTMTAPADRTEDMLHALARAHGVPLEAERVAWFRPEQEGVTDAPSGLETAEECWCYVCDAAGLTSHPLPLGRYPSRLNCCPDCGSKRCRRGGDHTIECHAPERSQG